MPYNPPYYPALLESCGLRKAKDLYAYTIDDTAVMPEKVLRITELVRKKTNITFRSINFARLKHEIEVLKSVYNSAWAPNWGFYPMTEEEFDYMAKELKRFAVPDLILIAEVDGKPAGFSLALPDIYQALKRCNGRLFPFGIFKFLRDRKKIDRARVMVLGIAEGFRRRGIDALFYLETFQRGKKLGYKRGELSWVLEDNVAMNSPIEAIGARLYKKYRIYEEKIS
jgi:GNAT superfamily N-acetyltransferase